MRWRNITEQEIIKVIREPDRKERLTTDKFHFYKSIYNRYLRVTIVLEESRIIIISAVDKSD